MRFRIIAALIGSMALSACMAPPKTTVARLDAGEQYPPTAHVEIVTDAPSRPHTQIAILETKGAGNLSFPELLTSLQAKGREIGANAIILVGSDRTQGATNLIYNPYIGGHQTITGAGSMSVTGIAVKYL